MISKDEQHPLLFRIDEFRFIRNRSTQKHFA
ncbi:hypothetical protein HNQ40_000261 [Algisphaera agarilytica]|uniref:Uncharacterized protein n=1 Tax=Algisphaera agarilytica TaxID=1385975 RepID=A0A7X0H620_9BACT|nr:hypothetical protein [Algisphaera agarilytica]